jgi:parallel beta-helix repeat protein
VKVRRICSISWGTFMQQSLLTIRKVALIAAIALTGITSSSALAATVNLSPGNNIQKAVNNNPGGTTFVLKSGTYREQSVTSLKNGDSFVGQNGADLNGSKILTGWKTVTINGKKYWTTAAGAPLPTPGCLTVGGNCCEARNPGCNNVQDLYVNSVDYIHATSLANVKKGSWYYDYNGGGGVRNNVYLYSGEKPNTSTVELGATTYAFEGGAPNITIKNLIVEKYATPLRYGAVQPQGANWKIENSEFRLNHGWAIKARPGGNNVQVLNNNVHDNGEGGVSTGAINKGLIQGNQLVHNNIDGVENGSEADGCKITGSYITVSNNVVHDNDGNGLHADQEADHDTFNNNTSYSNTLSGIRYELSQHGTITNNTVYGNTGLPQITYSGSSYGIITGNVVTVNANAGGIWVNNIGNTRHNGFTTYKATGMQVTGNTVKIGSGGGEIADGLIDQARPAQPTIFTDKSNVWAHNKYQVLNMPWGNKSWAWGESGGNSAGNHINWATWLRVHPLDALELK